MRKIGTSCTGNEGVCGMGGTARLIPHFYTGWKQAFSLTPRPLYVRTGWTIQRYDGTHRFMYDAVLDWALALFPIHFHQRVKPQKRELQAAAPRLYWRGRCISEREMAAARSDPLVRVAPHWLTPHSSQCEELSRSCFCRKTLQVDSSMFTEIGGQQIH